MSLRASAWRPSTSSGERYATVPISAPVLVDVEMARASPKSPSLIRPSSAISTFSGLMSRWIRPASCAAPSPSTTGSISARARRGEQGALVLEDVAQGVALDVLHHQVGHPVVLALVQDSHDVRVREPGGGLGLAAQPVKELRVAGHVGVQHLQRHITLQPAVGGHVNGGHPAAGEPGLNQVPAIHQGANKRVRRVFLHYTILIAARKRARIHMRSGPVSLSVGAGQGGWMPPRGCRSS